MTSLKKFLPNLTLFIKAIPKFEPGPRWATDEPPQLTPGQSAPVAIWGHEVVDTGVDIDLLRPQVEQHGLEADHLLTGRWSSVLKVQCPEFLMYTELKASVPSFT